MWAGSGSGPHHPFASSIPPCSSPPALWSPQITTQLDFMPRSTLHPSDPHSWLHHRRSLSATEGPGLRTSGRRRVAQGRTAPSGVTHLFSPAPCLSFPASKRQPRHVSLILHWAGPSIMRQSQAGGKGASPPPPEVPPRGSCAGLCGAPGTPRPLIKGIPGPAAAARVSGSVFTLGPPQGSWRVSGMWGAGSAPGMPPTRQRGAFAILWGLLQTDARPRHWGGEHGAGTSWIWGVVQGLPSGARGATVSQREDLSGGGVGGGGEGA